LAIVRPSSEDGHGILGAAILPEHDPQPAVSGAASLSMMLAVTSLIVVIVAERFEVVLVATLFAILFSWIAYRVGMRPRRISPQTTSLEDVIAYPIMAALIALAALVVLGIKCFAV
jgi:hypothetical protein